MGVNTIGCGPWFVGLLFNLTPNGTNKKQTELRIHGNVDIFATLRNLYNPKDTWVTMMVVGPFYKYTHALRFFQLWSRQTRGKARRLKRAITLLKRYHKPYKLQMWIQQKTYSQVVSKIKHENAHYKKYKSQQLLKSHAKQLENEQNMLLNKCLKLKKLKLMLNA